MVLLRDRTLWTIELGGRLSTNVVGAESLGVWGIAPEADDISTY